MKFKNFLVGFVFCLLFLEVLTLTGFSQPENRKTLLDIAIEENRGFEEVVLPQADNSMGSLIKIINDRKLVAKYAIMVAIGLALAVASIIIIYLAYSLFIEKYEIEASKQKRKNKKSDYSPEYDINRIENERLLKELKEKEKLPESYQYLPEDDFGEGKIV
jgi:hypothetical protein